MQEQKNPLIERTLSLLVEDNLNDNEVNKLFREIGAEHGLSHIAITECNDTEHSIKCTYEWSSDELLPLLYTEHRFLDSPEYDNWKSELITNEGYKVIYSGDQKDYDRMIRTDVFGTLIRIPMIINSNAIGCLDFYSEEYEHEWQTEETDEYKQIAWILASYILHLISMRRNNDDEQVNTIEYDRITHLPKYEYFYRQLNEVRDNDPEGTIILLCIDFSNLKYLNDKYGYVEGNNFFLLFAQRIYDLSDNIISCCRSYSDNFIIAARADKTFDVETLKSVVRRIAMRQADAMHQRYFDCNIIVNIGIYILRHNIERLDQAISNANLARKYAKLAKPDKGYRCLLYHAGMTIRMKRKAEYVAMIDTALANNDLVVELQPRCMTDTFDIIGAEALVRWDTHKGYMLYPDEFIKTLEEDGSIVKLDYYVYEKVFEYQYYRVSHNLPVVPIAVNVSVVHFYTEGLITYIRMLLRNYPVDPSLVEFEFNEQIYTSEISNVDTVIKELQEMGFNIIIDDFGSGYSCLNTFTKYHINGICLSRDFMKHKLDRNDMIIISCIVNMANKLDLMVVCEGVENDEQRDFLLKNDCQYMQGHYFSKSLSMDDFGTLLED